MDNVVVTFGQPYIAEISILRKRKLFVSDSSVSIGVAYR
jgi:hypothetical protein